MNTHKTLALVVLAGLGTFLYQLAQVLTKISDWSVIWNPPTVGQILLAIVAALVAVGAALGLDPMKILKGGGQ